MAERTQKEKMCEAAECSAAFTPIKMCGQWRNIIRKSDNMIRIKKCSFKAIYRDIHKNKR